MIELSTVEEIDDVEALRAEQRHEPHIARLSLRVRPISVDG